jgi:hypothetical protein
MRKRLITLSSVMVLLFITISCFDLSENIYSQVEVKNWFKSEKEIVMYSGRPYTMLQPFPEEQMLWSLMENASDELVIPGRDNGEWWEQGRWNELHTHQFTPNNKILRQSWEFVFEGISSCNEVLYVINDLDFEGKEQIIAEIKILRAFFYYWATDNWGSVPFTLDFAEKGFPPQQNRQFIYNYLVEEITNNISFLQAQPTPEYYGRVTKGVAYTLLSKVHMNAQEWIGEAKWEEAIDACNEVIALNAYQIEDDYFANFKINNEGSQENIFVIVYNSILTNDHLYWWTLTLNSASRATFNFIGEPWDGFVTEPDFFAKYSANDLRRKSFLVGQQYDKAGAPIIINGENFVYTSTIGDYRGRKKWEGARCAKYEYQDGLQYYDNDMENDFALFRYSDVLYTKLEALWRLGRAGEFIDDPDLQKIRTRAGLAPYAVGDLNASELLDELGREFAWEGKRRNDQIRFGVWGNAWWNKPVSVAKAKLFPIPQTALAANPNLVQNPY